MKCECCGQDIRQEASDQFEAFWKIWPNKVKRKKVLATWKSRKLDAMAELIIANVLDRLENDSRWAAGYIPDPTTYINGDLWEDEFNSITAATIWPTKNEDWETLGRKHHIAPGRGENWSQYKVRVKLAAEAG